MAIVYRHRRNDTNEVFYIGIGKTEKRAFNKNNNRSNFWHNIINKTSYSVEIIAKELSWKDACELECLLIQEYGRKDLKTGSLVNLTSGGDGSKGFKHTEEYKLNLSKRLKGKPRSEETKLKIGKSNKGRVPPRSTIEKARQINLGKTLSKEHLKVLSKPVLQLDLNNKIINKFKSCKEASVKTNTCSCNIARVCRGERKTANNYKWKYYE